MNLLGKIVWREYRTRITSRMFLVTTVIMFILLVGGPLVGARIFTSQSAKPVTVTVLDPTGSLMGKLQSALDTAGAAAANGEGPLRLERAAGTDATALTEAARQGQIEGLLLLEGATPDQYQAHFYTSSTLVLGRVHTRLQAAIAAVFRSEQLAGRTVDPEVLRILQAPPKADFTQLTSGQQGKEKEAVGRTVLAQIFNMLMYIGILAYAAIAFQGVLEEKTSRVMELLVAAVRPPTLLLGKVLGIGLVGLTQFATWIIAGGVLMLVPSEAGSALRTITDAVSHVPASFYLYLLLYFVLGYFLYAALYAAAGSTISRMEDSQALLTPLTMLVVVAYMASTFSLMNPSGSVARWSSLVPFFSPMVMVTRLALAAPAWWEVVASLLLLLAAIGAIVWLGGRIYRVGVLLYGARPTWKLLWRYIRAG